LYSAYEEGIWGAPIESLGREVRREKKREGAFRKSVDREGYSKQVPCY